MKTTMNKLSAATSLGLLFAFAPAAFAAVTLEAEGMTRSAYALDGAYIRVADGSTSGTASATFDGPNGTYDIQVHIGLENAGRPTLEVYKGSSQLHRYLYPSTTSTQKDSSYKISGKTLATGDVIKLVGFADAGALARVDKLVFTPVGTAAATTTTVTAVAAPVTTTTTTATTTAAATTTTAAAAAPVALPAPALPASTEGLMTSRSKTIQAESMARSGYSVDGNFIRVADGSTSGTASTTYSGLPGKYNLHVYVLPEAQGTPTVEVYRNSKRLQSVTYPAGDGQTVRYFTISDVDLVNGDALKIVGMANNGALARVDKIVVSPAAFISSPTANGAFKSLPAQPIETSPYPPQGSTGGLPVIPGASGFGINTTAGRGGVVHRVTNLNASGTGSLKACVDASGPRVCIFEVSGTIHQTSVLTIKNGNITIAGQTAPSPGVLIRGAGLSVEASDVLIQHIRVRVGDDSAGPGSDRDVFSVLAGSRNVNNVVFDHVSGSWSTDEIFSTWANPNTSYKITNVTVRNSVFTEALSYSAVRAEEHSAGLMIGPGTSNVTLVNNLLGFNGWRNPLIRDNSTGVMVVNNLLYRTRGATNDQIDFGTKGSLNTPMRASVVGNNFVLAPGLTPRPTIYINSGAATDFRLFQKDNLGPLHSASNPWAVVALNGRSLSSVDAGTAPIWAPGVIEMAAKDVEGYVVKNAGARPADRDPVDARIMANVVGRQGGIINHPSDVGGWPTLPVNVRPLTLPANPNVTNPSGYTNLELWLHEMARQVEGS